METPNRDTANNAAAAADVALIGTLSYSDENNGERRHVIKGESKVQPDKMHFQQSFELARTLHPFEFPYALPMSDVYKGMFEYEETAGSDCTAEESNVKLSFSRDEDDVNSSFSVKGEGGDQFGIFKLKGTATKKSDDPLSYAMQLEKGYNLLKPTMGDTAHHDAVAPQTNRADAVMSQAAASYAGIELIEDDAGPPSSACVTWIDGDAADIANMRTAVSRNIGNQVMARPAIMQDGTGSDLPLPMMASPGSNEIGIELIKDDADAGPPHSAVMLAEALPLDEGLKKPAAKKDLASSNIRQQTRARLELPQDNTGSPYPHSVAMLAAARAPDESKMLVVSIDDDYGPPALFNPDVSDWDYEVMAKCNNEGKKSGVVAGEEETFAEVPAPEEASDEDMSRRNDEESPPIIAPPNEEEGGIVAVGDSTETNEPLAADVTVRQLHQQAQPYFGDGGEIIVPEATLVSQGAEPRNENIPSATVVQHDNYSLTIAGRKIPLYIISVIAILILGGVAALSLTLPKELPINAPSNVLSLSLNPTHAPSISNQPTSVLQAKLMGTILGFSGETIINYSFSDSRHTALEWLIDDQVEMIAREEILSDAEMVERFVLAVIFFETDGGEWFNSFDFMNTEKHVCEWKGRIFQTHGKGVTGCTPDRRVSNLIIYDNNLQGELPTEIGMLQKLINLTLGFNDIKGSIPSTLGLLNITYLDLNNNDLDGDIASLAGLKKLRYLDLSSNELTGNLNIANNLTNLKSFKVDANKLSGSIPKSLANMSSLDTLYLQRNQFTGNLNFLCHDLPSDYQLDCDGHEPELQCNCCIGCTAVNDGECSPDNEKSIFLEVTTGNSSNGFQWHLHRVSGLLMSRHEHGILIAAGGKYDHDERINMQLCLPFPGKYTLSTSIDSIENGTSPEILLSIDDCSTLILVGNLYYDHSYIELALEGTVSMVSPATGTRRPTSNPTTTKYPNPTSNPTTTTIYPTPGRVDASSPEPTNSPTYYYYEQLVGKYYIDFALILTTDAFGMDTSWEVHDKNEDAIVLSNGSFGSNQTFQFYGTLDPLGCYEFVIKDAWGDGICCEQGDGSYKVSMDGQFFGSGGNFESSERVWLGGDC